MLQARTPHVVVLTSPGVGHAAPVAEFTTRLATHHGLTSTIITYTNLSSPTNSSPLAFLPPGLSTTALPEVPLDDLPADTGLTTLIVTVVQRSLPHLRALLRSLLESPAGITVFLTDMLCPAALAVAEELGLPRYVFYPSSLMSLCWMLHTPELARTTSCDLRDLPEPILLPGCLPMRAADFPDPLQNRADPEYALVVDMCRDYFRSNGFIVNTFDAMDQESLQVLKDLSDKAVYPPAYAVGPFIRPFSDKSAEHRCMRWLDEQPDGSVLYVCFGSGGTLSAVQTMELAAGLEVSGQRFLWVVRFPSDKDSSASYFGSRDHVDDQVNYLPEGFTERTKGVGLVVSQWAPQVEVLAHRAVGGFLSHCGWNSALETMSAGVPVLAWPLFAEQKINAVKLASEHVGVALRLPLSAAREDGVVPREEVAAAVTELMAGETGAMARKKARELQVEAQKASAPGGAAHQALSAVVDMWKRAGTSPVVAVAAAAGERGP